MFLERSICLEKGKIIMYVNESLNYIFSVVTAVYNVEEFLEESLDSLIEQDFGFDKIQLILVNDGSTDNSAEICDKYKERYPDNIIVIHKENGGVASARNEGLKYATGQYINFMDSDDKFSSDVFSKVFDFYSENPTEIDVVTIPLEFFDAQTGSHWQNDKFKEGTRIIDLYYEHQTTLMFVNASFFANRVKPLIQFDSHLVCGEDIKVLLTVLAEKMKVGVVSDCKYFYRRRSFGESSLIQSAKKKRGWYFDYFTYLVDWAKEYFEEKFGHLPAMVQYELLCDLQWRYREIYSTEGILTEEEYEQYKSRLKQTLKYFDDPYFLQQKMIYGEHKCMMLAHKYDRLPTLTERETDVCIHFGNTIVGSVSKLFSMVEFINIKDNNLIIEGFTKIMGVTIDEPINLFLEVNGELFECKISNRELINEYRLDELLFRGLSFESSVPLEKVDNFKIRLILQYKDSHIWKRVLKFGKFSPISTNYKNSYYFKDGWAVKTDGLKLEAFRCSNQQHRHLEKAYQSELWQKNRTGAKKAVYMRKAYNRLRKAMVNKEVWLISDRSQFAGDNGEAFFKYVNQVKPKNVELYFVINKESPDYERISKYGKVVSYLSWKHKVLHLVAKKIISSHADDSVLNPFFFYSEPYRDILQEKDFVFLQHGITKDDATKWFNRYKTNTNGFVTSSPLEHKSILDYEYAYTPEKVWLTGMPRYDELYRDEQRIITIMPTWRAYLVKNNNATGIRTLSQNFEKSAYYSFYSELLQNSRLQEAAKRYNYKVMFVNHPNMKDSDQLFEALETEVTFDKGTPYKKLFAESDLLVTDYSSVAFDFAYLRKPIVYCQFDQAEFFSGEHTLEKGYYDYEINGFGEIETEIETTVNSIIEYMKTNCEVKEMYRERMNTFFAYSDQNNNQRVLEKILEMK